LFPAVKKILETFTAFLSAIMPSSLSNNSQVVWLIIRSNHRQQNHEWHATANLISWNNQAMRKKLS